MIDEAGLRAVVQRYTHTVGGVCYLVSLWRVAPRAGNPLLPADAVDLDFPFSPEGGGAPRRLRLRCSEDGLLDHLRLLSRLELAIDKVLDGRLPPGTTEYN
jgi:hypothetical protein